MKLAEVGKALDAQLTPRFILIENVFINPNAGYHCKIMRVITMRLSKHVRLQLACYYDEYLHLNMMSDLGTMSYLLDGKLNSADIKKINDNYGSFLVLLGHAIVAPVFSLSNIIETVKLYMHLFSYMVEDLQRPIYNNNDNA